MNTIIKTRVESWLDGHPKAKQWLWFIVLWMGGLLTVLTVTYPIKLLIKSLR